MPARRLQFLAPSGASTRNAGRRRRRAASPAVVALALATVGSFAVAMPAAVAADRGAGPQTADADPDYNGLDYTRPQESVGMRLRFQNSSSPNSQTDQERLYLNVSTRFDVPDAWRIALQGQVPYIERQNITSSPQNTVRESGLGDAFVQGSMAHDIDARWALGIGARLQAPTGADSLGTGKWQIMPGIGFRYSFLDVGRDTYFAPVLRWALSFAGNPGRPDIDQPQIAPTFNVGLPDHWFFTLYPSNDIRINVAAPVAGQTGQLFLPLDVAVGRNITDRITALLEMSVPIIKEYPVYNFKTEFRMSVKF